MSANTLGHLFRVTTFGESHGPALGAVVDGCPAGVEFDNAMLQTMLARRRPGQSDVVSDRAEPDAVEVLSGVYDGKTLGTPIAMCVRNRDARPEEYAEIEQKPRPGHADDTWRHKRGHVDPRGGGRASGRETVARVMGAAVARMLLSRVVPGIDVIGYARAIGPFALSDAEAAAVDSTVDVDRHPARFPSDANAAAVRDLLTDAKRDGLSYGGIAELRLDRVPAGLGQPVFRKLKADLAGAFLGVGATAGVEFGAGFAAAAAEGSEFHRRDDAARYGGIRGGIATGEPIFARVAFKPTATVLDTARRGRHDPCIVPRAIPVLEAMAWLVLADHWLLAGSDRVEAR